MRAIRSRNIACSDASGVRIGASSAAILVGWIGTTALAAHQIALQVASILFMIPFGISLAATVRVGHAVGRRDPVASRRAGFTAILLGGGCMVVVTLATIAVRN